MNRSRAERAVRYLNCHAIMSSYHHAIMALPYALSALTVHWLCLSLEHKPMGDLRRKRGARSSSRSCVRCSSAYETTCIHISVRTLHCATRCHIINPHSSCCVGIVHSNIRGCDSRTG